MHGRAIAYRVGQNEFEGYLALDESIKSTKPGVVIAHAWRGHDEFVREKALALARLGYVAFAADVYGKNVKAKNDEEALELMRPLFINRKELQSRINGAFEVLKTIDGVDQKRLGAIGFCFGGLTVLELLRSGVDIKGVVSFHGVLGDSLEGVKADPAPKKQIQGSILFLHGYEDPLVTKDDLASIQRELSDAGVDWQMHIYGQTAHAFMNPKAKDKAVGLYFQSHSAKRAWLAMENYFKEMMKE